MSKKYTTHSYSDTAYLIKHQRARMKFSIVIPTFNEEKHIEACLKSVIQATKNYSDECEIIVVDNQSTDNTQSLIMKYPVKLVISDADNASGVRNAGGKFAKFEYITFFDGDCVIDIDWFNRVSLKIDNENIGAYGGGCEAPESANWVVKGWNPEKLKTKNEKNAKLPGANFTIRADVYDKLNGFDESLVSAEDDELSLRIINNNYRCVIDNTMSITHLGYPESLTDVYRKQQWHGATQITAHGFFGDKMVIVTQLWIMSWVLICLSLLWSNVYISALGGALFITCPFLVSLNRLRYFSEVKLKVFISNMIIGYFFLCGRAVGLLKECAQLIVK